MNERPLSASPSSFLFHFLSLLFMALLIFLPQPNSDSKKQQPSSKPKRSRTHHKHQNSYSSAWHQIKNFWSCKQVEGSRVHDPSKKPVSSMFSCSKLGSCSFMCSFRDFVHGNTRVVHRADNSPGSSSMGQETGLLRGKETNGPLSSSFSSRSFSGSVRSTYSDGSSFSSSSRGMQFGKLSGFYECHTTVDPSRFPIPTTTLCACSQCGEVFQKIESLEHHQAVRRAVSELGPDDSSRNIVEIIFKSSWLKKGSTICKIERILKVHNTQRTIQWFEECRDAVKIRANSNTKKNPRCAADGNELLRFHCTTLTCTLWARGSTSLCGSLPSCGVCTVIPHGFQGKAAGGILTTASSGRAHDCLEGVPEGRRAMLVCRVIAGRVRRVVGGAATEEDGGSAAGLYDSVARYAGIYSNPEELYVFNPRAILPCFLVIYQALDPYV